MRSVVLAILALLLVSQAAGQMLTDPIGDVKAEAGGQQTAVAPATALDLAALNVSEDPDGFRFTVTVADLGDDQARPDAGAISVYFLYDNITFRLDYYRSFDNAAYFGGLYSARDGQSFQWIRQTVVSRDLVTSTVWQDLPRYELVGASGKVPGRGDLITDIRVAAVSNGPSTVGIEGPASGGLVDVMPDGAGALGTLTVRYHGQEGVGASLTSPKPFRSSNGEATTYEYQVTARQAGSAPMRFTLMPQDVPQGWNVSLPGTVLELAPDTPVVFPVRIAVPFNHMHGASQSLTLRLENADRSAWATLDLGVHYLTVAQPAGHHPTLYLHSQDWSNTAYYVNPAVGGSTGAMTMNTMETDLSDTKKPVQGYSNIGGTQARWTWNVCLSPELAIGLDMDLEASGTFSIPVLTTRPLAGASFSGRLIHLAPGEQEGPWCFGWADRKQTVLANLEGTPQDLASNSPTLMTGTIRSDPAGDYMPYADGAQLVLQLVLTSNDPAIGGTAGPYIQPGASVTMPFREYHEVGSSGFVSNGTAAPISQFVSEAPPEESPGAGMALVVALAAVALALRGRTT